MIYFDNASSTKLDYKVIRKMNYNYKYYYNYSSILNYYGKKNKKKIEKNRKEISSYIGCLDKEFFFTHSSTESNNIVIIGFLKNKKDYIVLTTKTEHLSVLNSIKNLKNKTIFFKCKKNGLYNLKSLSKILKKNNKSIFFLAITIVNNETGVIQNIRKIKKIIKNYNVFLFADCSQVIGKYNLNLKKIDIDFASLSSSKSHGPQGIAGLYIRKKFIKKIKPIFYGGKQEKGLVSGSISNFLVSGFKKSIEISFVDFDKNYKIVSEINNYFIKKIKNNKNLKLNSSIVKVPHIINFHIKNIVSSIYLKYLKKFFFTKTSSCESNKKFGSHVLKAMGKNKYICENSIRISFSKYNKIKEIKLFYKKIKKIIKLFKI
ncbi:aminotransferase class V-fold PLP-dependent enzyme [Candidatus Vidania fulgoroideorum]